MNKDLTQGPVMRSMLLFAVPMILGNLLQQCYNVADTLIVSWYLGPDALAAVGSASNTLGGEGGPLAELVLKKLDELRGCDAHFSIILSEEDTKLYNRLGIHVSCEPKYEIKKLYHK